MVKVTRVDNGAWELLYVYVVRHGHWSKTKKVNFLIKCYSFFYFSPELLHLLRECYRVFCNVSVHFLQGKYRISRRYYNSASGYWQWTTFVPPLQPWVSVFVVLGNICFTSTFLNYCCFQAILTKCIKNVLTVVCRSLLYHNILKIFLKK